MDGLFLFVVFHYFKMCHREELPYITYFCFCPVAAIRLAQPCRGLNFMLTCRK